MSILIFPEGTRSLTDTIQDFKSGSFLIAYNTNVQIVPIVLKNTLKIKRKKSFFINPLPIYVKILNPIPTLNLLLKMSKKIYFRILEKIC